MASRKSNRSKHPEQLGVRKASKNLRDRVAGAIEIPEPLRAECLVRLDGMVASRPRLRRPSWTLEAAPQASYGRERRNSHGSVGSDTSHGSSEGAKSGCGKDPWDVDGGRLATNRSTCSITSRQTWSEQRAEQPGLNGIVSSVSATSWSNVASGRLATGPAWQFRPAFPPSTLTRDRDAKKQGEHQEQRKHNHSAPLRSSQSTPLFPPPPAPECHVVEAREAVSAARYTLRTAAAEDGIFAPTRGANSLLRTSLRFALQA